MTRRRLLLALGAGISLALGLYALSVLDWPIFWDSLASIRYGWLAAAGAAILTSVAGRTIRWRHIAALEDVGITPFWRAATIGYLGNFVLPLRAGEILRIWVLSRLAPVSLPAAATSAFLDRLADIAAISLVFAFVTAAHGSDAVGIDAVGGLVAVLGVGIILLVFLVVGRRHVLSHLAGHGPTAWKTFLGKVHGWLDEATEVVRGMVTFRRASVIVILSLAIFGVDFLGMWLVMAAFGWTLPFLAAMTLGSFLAISSGLPSAPGYVGIYQVAAIFALQIYGIEASQAVAYSVVLQLLTFSIFVILGNLSILQSAVSMNQLFRLARSGQVDGP